MVHISRVTLAAIAVLLTNISFGAAETGAVVHLHQRMGPNDEPGASASTSGVQPSCAPVAGPEKDNVKRDASQSSQGSTPLVEIVPKDTRKRTKRDEDIPKAYLVSTVDGITQAQYEEFAKKPPLGDKQGDIIAFEGLEWVSCQYLNLTDAEAAIVREDPIIAWAEPITEEAGEALVIPQHSGTNSLYTRATLPQSLNQRDDSAAHLRLLSARNQRNDPAQLPNYVFEPSLGQGQTIYVLDSGYRKSHQEFDASEREVRDFVVPNRHTLAGIPLSDDQKGPEDMTDINGHGTMVASVAAGYVSGVASKANLVVVKMRNSAKNPNKPSNPNLLPRGVMDSALEFAFAWTIDDIRRQKLQNTDPNARYIINLSYGK
jgi:subtilisin family serine protease